MGVQGCVTSEMALAGGQIWRLLLQEANKEHRLFPSHSAQHLKAVFIRNNTKGDGFFNCRLGVAGNFPLCVCVLLCSIERNAGARFQNKSFLFISKNSSLSIPAPIRADLRVLRDSKGWRHKCSFFLGFLGARGALSRCPPPLLQVTHRFMHTLSLCETELSTGGKGTAAAGGV